MAAAVLVLEVGVRDSTALVPDKSEPRLTSSTVLSDWCRKHHVVQKSLQGFALKPQIEYSVRYRTRYGHKKVVRCINNVSVEVVYLRAEHSENKCFLPCYATDKGKS